MRSLNRKSDLLNASVRQRVDDKMKRAMNVRSSTSDLCSTPSCFDCTFDRFLRTFAQIAAASGKFFQGRLSLAGGFRMIGADAGYHICGSTSLIY
jgi:hypothetical protein